MRCSWFWQAFGLWAWEAAGRCIASACPAPGCVESRVDGDRRCRVLRSTAPHARLLELTLTVCVLLLLPGTCSNSFNLFRGYVHLFGQDAALRLVGGRACQLPGPSPRGGAHD